MLDTANDTLFNFQRRAVKHLISRGAKGGLFFEMGTGKTRTALAVARAVGSQRILVVAPLSAIGVWENEVRTFWKQVKVFPAANGKIRQRSTLLAPLDCEVPSLSLINYESYWREPLRSALIASNFDFIIYDEAHRLKNYSSRQARFAHALTGYIPYRLALTGTPMPNGIEDLYSIYKAIDPTVFGMRWNAFASRYLVYGGYQFYQIVGYKNTDEVQKKLSESSCRVTKAEALELPEATDVVVPVKMRSMYLYNRMRQKAISAVADSDHGMMMPRTALESVMRLQQLTSGFAKMTDGSIRNISDEKINVLRDLLYDMVLQKKRVVVFCRFHHDIDKVAEEAKSFAPTYTYDGRTSTLRKTQRIEQFRSQCPAILVMQISVALGLDLSCANIAIFYSLDFSYANYVQSKDRLHRYGQRNCVTYYHLIAQKTVDEKIYRVLARKGNVAREILDRASFERFVGSG